MDSLSLLSSPLIWRGSRCHRLWALPTHTHHTHSLTVSIPPHTSVVNHTVHYNPQFVYMCLLPCPCCLLACVAAALCTLYLPISGHTLTYGHCSVHCMCGWVYSDSVRVLSSAHLQCLSSYMYVGAWTSGPQPHTHTHTHTHTYADCGVRDDRMCLMWPAINGIERCLVWD